MLDLEKVLETMNDVKNNMDCGKLEHIAYSDGKGLILTYIGLYRGFHTRNNRYIGFVELLSAVDPMGLIQIGCEELVRTFCTKCGDV